MPQQLQEHNSLLMISMMMLQIRVTITHSVAQPIMEMTTLQCIKYTLGSCRVHGIGMANKSCPAEFLPLRMTSESRLDSS